MNLSDHFDAISFSGCGTLNFYQCGFAHQLQQVGLPNTMKYAGASAGAGLGVLLAQGSDAREVAEVALSLLRPYANANILVRSDVLKTFADGFLGHFFHGQTLARIGNRVSISITRVPSITNWTVNEFADRFDLEAAVRASCHIPSRKMRTVRFRNQRCMDGGFSNNSPVCSPKTLRVSPFFFDARADVFPSPKVGPWWAIKVPPVDKAWELFEHGERDAVALLQRLQAPNQTIPLKHINTDANDRSSDRFPLKSVLQSEPKSTSI